MNSDAKKDDSASKERIHKTKLIRFFGRAIPIILQNDNGPCPLLAICNILLLRNNLNLNPDTAEVSQEKLLSLVAERLIDSNSNVNNKDAGYVQNQQQNIADAIDLLPQLATGIDVNVKFRRIDDFEFTRECAIFDLLDIPLYHGWLVDPQDLETSSAIGSKSYNTLTGDLVALETKDMMKDDHVNGDNSVDFIASTTATLGVPSPSLSRLGSLNKYLISDSENSNLRKGDVEEQAELLRVLKLSRSQSEENTDSFLASSCKDGICSLTDKSFFAESVSPSDGVHRLEGEPSVGDETNQVHEVTNNSVCKQTETISVTTDFSPCAKIHEEDDKMDDNPLLNNVKQTEMPPCDEGGCLSMNQSISDDVGIHGGSVSASDMRDSQCLCQKEETVDKVESCDEHTDTIDDSEAPPTSGTLFKGSCDVIDICSSEKGQDVDMADALSARIDAGEPIYAGEECILESNSKIFENTEPLYEGEVVLAKKFETGEVDLVKKSDTDSLGSSDTTSEEELALHKGELLSNFLRNTASQLTFYGLFCLRDGLKERELCVFFRNNHFSAMFKFQGELYLLATDQGFINQPDLVWEKLNEVNGDSLFMTDSFNEFRIENRGNRTWNEKNAVTTTADYISGIDNISGEDGCDNNSYDLQLAIALQQQEFQQEPEQKRKIQSGPSTDSSKLVTGPPQEGGKSGGRSMAPVHQRHHPHEDKPFSKNRCSLM